MTVPSMSESLAQHDFVDVLERWSGTESLNDAFAVFADVAADFGFDQVNYFDMKGTPTDPINGNSQLIGNEKDIWTFDKSWFDYYMGQSYGPIDPVFPWLTVAKGPFKWADAEKSVSLSRRQTLLMRESEDAGLYGGFSIPLRGPNGQLSALCIAASCKDASIARGFHTCGLLGQHFHNVAMSLGKDAFRDSTETILTEREREVLAWCAEGKSNWAIGEILGISEHSVKFHVQNIYRKLDANSRIAAVVKAIRMGLIQP